ncbi:MAG: HAD hydrolase-like protein [Planctomycetes bacterium]|nr:HAD hydrolase-like protein [Planctomycetota bacterium]
MVEGIELLDPRPIRPLGFRKPEPGSLIDAGREAGADFSRSWIIGKREADIGAGIAAGYRSTQLVRAFAVQPKEPHEAVQIECVMQRSSQSCGVLPRWLEPNATAPSIPRTL